MWRSALITLTAAIFITVPFHSHAQDLEDGAAPLPDTPAAESPAPSNDIGEAVDDAMSGTKDAGYSKPTPEPQAANNAPVEHHKAAKKKAKKTTAKKKERNPAKAKSKKPKKSHTKKAGKKSKSKKKKKSE